MMPKQGTLRGIYSLTDYEPLSLERVATFFRLLEEPDPSTPDSPFFGSLFTRPDRPYFRLLDLMSVRFLVVSKLDQSFKDGLVELGWKPFAFATGGDFGAFRNPNTLPRSYVAHQVIPVRGAADALVALASPSFDFRKTAVIESEAAEIKPLPPSPDTEITPVLIKRHEPNRVELFVHNPAPGYLVLTDAHYPGWKATINGRPQPILRANYLFRAVRLPAGDHRITVTYAPRSFAIGSGITIMTLVGLAAWGIHGAVRRRSRREPA